MRHALCTLLVGVGFSSAIVAAGVTPHEKAVWQMEETYWRYVQAGDVERYVMQYPDGTASGAGIWRKFTHTWKKTGGRWQIITGMCAAQEPLKTPRL